MRAEPPAVSAVVAVLGNYLDLYPEVDRLVSDIAQSYSGEYSGIELIVVPHTDSWRMALPFGNLSAQGVRITSPVGVPELPALLFNHGAREAHGSFLAFAWPGVDFRSWLTWIERCRREGVLTSGRAFSAARPSPSRSQRWSATGATPASYDGGWVEMFDYVPMAGSLISREYFCGEGGFSASPLLQRGFWWEFTARTTRTDSIAMLDSDSPACRWSGADYPLANDVDLSSDLVARRVIQRSGVPRELRETCDWDDAAVFTEELPRDARHRVWKLLSQWRPDGGEGRADPSGIGGQSADPLRIVVLGGMDEPAHDQLCFFNYFELLEGRGVLTWRIILDRAAQPVDVTKADLVIFSRTRSENASRLMDCCNRFGIPAVYMLDDNWFAVGKEWEEYAEVFTPGAKPYEEFLYCLTRADRVLTYNPILAEDLRPYSRNLELLPVNVKLSLFPTVPRPPPQTGGGLRYRARPRARNLRPPGRPGGTGI